MSGKLRDEQEMMEQLYEALTGAMTALRLIEADEILPGYASVNTQIEEAIDKYERLFRKGNLSW